MPLHELLLRIAVSLVLCWLMLLTIRAWWRTRELNVIEAVFVIGATLGLAANVAACTSSQLDQIEDASNKREVICKFVRVWAPTNPDLNHLVTLCDAGADLQDIAAAYAGCRPDTQEPTKPEAQPAPASTPADAAPPVSSTSSSATPVPESPLPTPSSHTP